LDTLTSTEEHRLAGLLLNNVPPDSNAGSQSATASPVRPHSHAAHAVETLQTVLTALLLAFVFRAFMVEAFIIPTGSMAHSLLGAHATRTCPACGWEYDFVPEHDTFCPNCHLRTPLRAADLPEKSGDRILVHKWPYVLGGVFGPRRWDVIVFRNPADPSESYIKRLVGLPGETVEIVDGDVYINGQIARKTAAAQSVLWFVVFDQNHLPPESAASAGPRWVADVGPGCASAWSGLDRRLIRFDGERAPEQAIIFAPPDEEYAEDVYGYNRGPSARPAPLVGDQRLVADVTFQGGEGVLCWELLRDGKRFGAEIRRDGRVSLTLSPVAQPDQLTLIGETQRGRLDANRPYAIEFGHLDYRVYVKIDGKTAVATDDAQYRPDLQRLREFSRTAPLRMRLTAEELALELRGVRIDRDVYYTYRNLYTQRAYPGHLFVLNADEYFVLGDNSPDSRDSREWVERGAQLPEDYRIGTVRGDQIVGQAAFVYLPGLLPEEQSGRWWLPDLGRVRFVR
jgi:signal peptidase I